MNLCGPCHSSPDRVNSSIRPPPTNLHSINSLATSLGRQIYALGPRQPVRGGVWGPVSKNCKSTNLKN
jgi:hypothetical protein